jgi:hypothetical protein
MGGVRWTTILGVFVGDSGIDGGLDRGVLDEEVIGKSSDLRGIKRYILSGVPGYTNAFQGGNRGELMLMFQGLFKYRSGQPVKVKAVCEVSMLHHVFQLHDFG